MQPQAGVYLADAVLGPALGDYRTMIRSRPCHVIVLLPPGEAVDARRRSSPMSCGPWS